MFFLNGNGRFIELSDTPDSYVGQASKVPIVNPGGTGLIFVDQSTIGGGGGGTPLDTTFNYNADGTVNTIVTSEKTTTFSYNLDLTVNTIDDETNILTFAYNADGTVQSITVSNS